MPILSDSTLGSDTNFVRFHILFNDHTGSYVESDEEIMP